MIKDSIAKAKLQALDTSNGVITNGMHTLNSRKQPNQGKHCIKIEGSTPMHTAAMDVPSYSGLRHSPPIVLKLRLLFPSSKTTQITNSDSNQDAVLIIPHKKT